MTLQDVGELSPETLADLRRSGLSDETIVAAQITDWGKGYRIPYVGSDGFYRNRLFEGEVKYKQRAGLGNHIYFPPNLPALWRFSPYLLITEGEKKALKACQEGFPCIAVGGVYSWRGAMPETDDDSHEARLQREDPVAIGLREIDFARRQVIIVFDNDLNPVSKMNVQQAAFEFGLWLESQGAKVGQVLLPTNGSSKVGLDDFLLTAGSIGKLKSLIEAEPGFPAPPNALKFVTKTVDEASPKTLRQAHRRAVRAIVADLDNHGRRYKDEAGNNYYFDNQTLSLHQFTFKDITQSSFGALLLESYRISPSDRNLFLYLEAAFTGLSPCPSIVPHRVISNANEAIYYQLSDSKIAKVTADAVRVVDNGFDDQLFLRGSVQPLDIREVQRAIARTQASTPTMFSRGDPRWLQALRTVNLQPMPGLTLDQTQKLITCLFYMSPWLLRWRNIQLPLEIAIAEANSGKTFLYNARKGILSGSASLQGIPYDFRGFVSSLQAADGLWVCDNLGHIERNYWEQLNNELARLITEPRPTIELRQLYTTSSVARIPVQCTFAITCIWNPLTKPDLIQRSMVFKLEAIPPGQRNSYWYTEQLNDRVGYIAEHLSVLQAFMIRCDKSWNNNYLSSYRLVNFEQSLIHMMHVLGFASDIPTIVANLAKLTEDTILDADSTIQGLKDFAIENPGKTVQAKDIVMWALADMSGAYSSHHNFMSPVILGKYLAANRSNIQAITGMEHVRRNNTSYWRVPDASQSDASSGVQQREDDGQ